MTFSGRRLLFRVALIASFGLAGCTGTRPATDQKAVWPPETVQAPGEVEWIDSITEAKPGGVVRFFRVVAGQEQTNSRWRFRRPTSVAVHERRMAVVDGGSEGPKGAGRGQVHPSMAISPRSRPMFKCGGQGGGHSARLPNARPKAGFTASGECAGSIATAPGTDYRGAGARRSGSSLELLGGGPDGFGRRHQESQIRADPGEGTLDEEVALASQDTVVAVLREATAKPLLDLALLESRNLPTVPLCIDTNDWC